MKSLYESLLDDDFDKGIEKEVGQAMITKIFGPKAKYNEKTGIVKNSETLHLVCSNGDVKIYNGVTRTDATLKDIMANYNIKGFDCNLLIATNVLKTGLKLSELGFCKKKGRINLYTVKTADIIDENMLGQFLDTDLPQDVCLSMDYRNIDKKLLSNPICKKFHAIKLMCSSFDHFEMASGWDVNNLIITFARDWLGLDRKYKSLEQLYNEKSYGYYNDNNGAQKAKQKLKEFMSKNSINNFLVDLGISNTYTIIDKDGESKGIIKGKNEWTKI